MAASANRCVSCVYKGNAAVFKPPKAHSNDESEHENRDYHRKHNCDRRPACGEEGLAAGVVISNTRHLRQATRRSTLIRGLERRVIEPNADEEEAFGE